MIRLLRIARREYLAYVRTAGFWLSLLLLPVGLSTIVIAPMALSHSTPIPRVAVIDFTGEHLKAAVANALAPPPGAKPPAVLAPDPQPPYADPADAARRVQPYLRGPTLLPDGQPLEAAAIVHPSGDTVAVDFWSRNIGANALEGQINRAIERQVRADRLKALGIDPVKLDKVETLSLDISDYSPRAAAGKVELTDQLPAIAGLAMGMLLWMVVLTGAGMLLNSVMEEKTSRIIEVLLSSASVPEIMGGKILGVACVTGTILVFWISIGLGVAAIRSPDLARALAGVLLNHGRWAYFALYFAGGYLMFATLYVTIGAFCETAREAQTLLGPMMIIMSVPPIFMSQSIGHPDAPLLKTLTWIPLFTPFMMAARSAADPPLWEILATAALMASVTALELWVAVPAFKAGALATGRFDIRLLFRSLARHAGP
ncbi:MAG TPA: ABC transporter permease [Caulobacteraceae bacterium]|jgi:ABC-2 type transport system permease protein